jgi:hypothetical protein
MSYRTLSFTLTAAALCLSAATAPTFAQSRDSAGFAYQYEASSGLPNVEDSGTGKTNWAPFLFTGSVSVADGLLSYSTMPNAGGGSWFESSADAPGSAWLAQVSATTSYTIEFRAKVTESVGIVPGLHVFADNGVNCTWFNVDTTKVAMGAGHGETAVLVSGVDNSSDFHVYRIAYDAVDVNLQVWRDGVAIAADLAPAQGTVYKVIGFGDATSDGSSAGSIDYFRWDPTGAYAPVPEPGMLTLLGFGALSLLVLRRK